MGPNVRRLFHRRCADRMTVQERSLIRSLRRIRDADGLSTREREAEAEVPRLIAAVRADPREPFRGEDDETIAAEILRRLGSGNGG